jgi:hypothetical protein
VEVVFWLMDAYESLLLNFNPAVRTCASHRGATSLPNGPSGPGPKKSAETFLASPGSRGVAGWQTGRPSRPSWDSALS